MDSFKEMAEEKMREAVSQQIQGEIDADEGELRAREQEFSALQATDTRAEKRQKWMQSISGKPRCLRRRCDGPHRLRRSPGRVSELPQVGHFVA